jgi:antitoxin component YwqK of YwqJK toxin-antitoxin module
MFIKEIQEIVNLLKSKISLLFLFAMFSVLFALGQTNPKHVKVKGYYRSDGTYVKPHYRTAPNSTNRDNFSTIGNYNPYTGQPGWIAPDNKILTYNSTNSTDNKNYGTYHGITNSYGEKEITYKNGKEVFKLCDYCSTIKTDSSIDYYWYTSKLGIQKTKGRIEGTPLQGQYRFYNERGKILIKGNYKRGVKDGEFIIWGEDGNIKEKAHFSNGFIDYITFTNDNGNRVEWIGEILEKGSVKYVYNKDGLLLENAIMLDNLYAKYKLYYDDGFTVESEFTKSFSNNYEGIYKAYYKSGRLKFQAFFKKGFRNDFWTWYDKDGKVTSILQYRIKELKYSNGNIKEKGSQYYDSKGKSWVKDGKWILFDINGEIEKIKFFDGGKEDKSREK